MTNQKLIQVLQNHYDNGKISSNQFIQAIKDLNSDSVIQAIKN